MDRRRERGIGEATRETTSSRNAFPQILPLVADDAIGNDAAEKLDVADEAVDELASEPLHVARQDEEGAGACDREPAITTPSTAIDTACGRSRPPIARVKDAQASSMASSRRPGV